MQLPVIPFKEKRAMKLARAAGVNPQSGFGRGDRAYGIPGYPAGVQVAGLGESYGDGMLHSRYGPVGSGGYGPLKGLSAYGYGSGRKQSRYGPLLLGAWDQWDSRGDTSRTSQAAVWPVRLGNMSAYMSDYINTPGTPGSSTFFLYGLGQDDDWWSTSDSPATTAMSTASAVTPSSSPSFWASLTDVVKTAAQAAPAVMQVINQQNAVQALNQGKITPAQYQMLMQQPTATIALQPSAGLATGLKIGGGTIALLGGGLLALMLLRKRR